MIFDDSSKENALGNSSKAIQNKNCQLKRLRVGLNALLEGKDSICVDKDLSDDVGKVIKNHTIFEKDEFKQMFWEQQV